MRGQWGCGVGWRTGAAAWGTATQACPKPKTLTAAVKHANHCVQGWGERGGEGGVGGTHLAPAWQPAALHVGWTPGMPGLAPRHLVSGKTRAAAPAAAAPECAGELGGPTAGAAGAGALHSSMPVCAQGLSSEPSWNQLSSETCRTRAPSPEPCPEPELAREP